MDWDEKKHPRDRKGKFAETENDDTHKDRRRELTKEQINLTNREWYMYYTVIGEKQRGDYAYCFVGGERVIPIGNKIIIDNGDYEAPQIKSVIEFETNDKMNDYLNNLLRRRILR